MEPLTPLNFFIGNEPINLPLVDVSKPDCNSKNELVKLWKQR